MFPTLHNYNRKEYLKLHPRTNTKHNASKRGYRHSHRLSRGELNSRNRALAALKTKG